MTDEEWLHPSHTISQRAYLLNWKVQQKKRNDKKKFITTRVYTITKYPLTRVNVHPQYFPQIIKRENPEWRMKRNWIFHHHHPNYIFFFLIIHWKNGGTKKTWSDYSHSFKPFFFFFFYYHSSHDLISTRTSRKKTDEKQWKPFFLRCYLFIISFFSWIMRNKDN